MGNNRAFRPVCGHQFVPRKPSQLTVLLSETTLQTHLYTPGLEARATVALSFFLRCGQCSTIIQQHIDRLELKHPVEGHETPRCRVRFTLEPNSRVLGVVGSEKKGLQWKYGAVFNLICTCGEAVVEPGTDFVVSRKVRTSQMRAQ